MEAATAIRPASGQPRPRRASTRRYAASEAARLLLRPRCWALIGCAVAFGAYNVLTWTANERLGAGGAFVIVGADAYPYFLPLMVGILSGAALAEDRARGGAALVLSRGLSRGAYLNARIAAAALSAAVAVALSGLCVILVALVALPGEATAVGHPERVVPSPDLYATSALANDLLAVLVLAAAAAGIATVTSVMGLFSTNVYAVGAAPFLGVFAASFVFSGEVGMLISPYTYLELSDGGEFAKAVGGSAGPYAGFAYWMFFAFAAWLIGRVVLRVRETL